MRRFRENLLLQFSITSLLITAIIAVVLAIVLSNKIRSDAIEALMREAVGNARGRLLRAITPTDLETPMRGARYKNFHEFVQHSIVSERTARVKLWAKDGTVIYSNDPSGVGEKFPTKHNLRKALGGENALEIKLPNAPENTRERYLGTLMEVYTPIIFPGATTPQGALEIYQYYEPTAQRIRVLRQRLFWSLGFGFVMLYGGLVSIVWGGWRTIKRQQASLTQTNLDLQAAHDKLLSANLQLSKEITERRRTEEAHKKLEAQVRQSQKMEAIGTLAGGIAHDFNNILSAVVGFTELALEDLPSGSPPSQCLQQVLTASARATELVRQILTFSRQSEQERTPVQLHLLVKETLTLLRASLPSTIDIRQQIAEAPSTILADPTQMHQVLLNLCVNAEHAMHDTGGILEVGVDAVEVDETLVGHHPGLHPGSYVRLTVRDTGCGIEPALIECVFDPFFTTKEIGEGTGMGLAVVHGIVSSHGGTITVQSAVGKGTTFTLYLPRIEATTDTRAHVEEPAPHGTGHILLIDDEEVLVRLEQEMLERLGYDVVALTSSLEALEVFRATPQHFDLVITDQTMPKMTGEALIQELRRIRPDIPIILCSGFDHAMHTEKTKALNIDAFLIKPLTAKNLGLAVQQTLARA